MRHRDLVALAPVVAHEQPPGEAFVDRVNRVGQGRVGVLHDRRLDEPQQDGLQAPAAMNDVQESHPFDAVSVTRHLDRHETGDAVGSKHDGRNDEAFPPYDPRFGLLVLWRLRDKGGNSAF